MQCKLFLRVEGSAVTLLKHNDTTMHWKSFQNNMDSYTDSVNLKQQCNSLKKENTLEKIKDILFFSFSLQE